MDKSHVDVLYEQQIRSLPREDRQRLLAMVERDLKVEPAQVTVRSLLELEGLGADIWRGVDAQRYVRELRAEWDERL